MELPGSGRTRTLVEERGRRAGPLPGRDRIVPLERKHIEAAERLWSRLDHFRRSDRALAALQGSLPGYDAESTLLKVLALHPIDTTQTHVGLPLARSIQAVLARTDPERCGPELVDALAAAARYHGKRAQGGLGFASRFAHHFVDGERFPVLDAWSERALQELLGGELAGAPGESRYARFARNFAWVAGRLGLTRRRLLGRWLWLSGQYSAWLANPRTAMHRSVHELFASGPRDLELLCAEGAPLPGPGGPGAPVPEPPPALPRSALPSRPPGSVYAPRRTEGRTRT